MFIDTELRPQGEVQQQIGKLKLSEAVRVGCELTEAGALYTRDSKCCVVGAALYAYLRDFDAVREKAAEVAQRTGRFGQAYLTALQELSNAPFEMVQQAEWRYMGGESRESIADWLESQGL